MSLSFHSNKECLYLQVYEHYKNLIMERRIPAGSRMPSLRKCSAELKLSRTTIENAYLQLAADGYIVARAQSGYYVTNIAEQKPVSTTSWHANLPSIQYDLLPTVSIMKVSVLTSGSVISKAHFVRVTVFSPMENPRVKPIFVRYLLTTSVSEETSTVLLTIL